MTPTAAPATKSYLTVARARAVGLTEGAGLRFVIAAVEQAAGTVRFAPVFLPSADEVSISVGLAYRGFMVIRT